MGTWIDGEPIYRKLFQGNVGNVNIWKYIGVISNIKEVTKIWGTIHANTENGEIGIPCESVYVEALMSGSVGVHVENRCLENASVKIIVEYTKTTE